MSEIPLYKTYSIDERARVVGAFINQEKVHLAVNQEKVPLPLLPLLELRTSVRDPCSLSRANGA